MTIPEAHPLAAGTAACLRRGAVAVSDFTRAAARLSIADGVRHVGGQAVSGGVYQRRAFAPLLPTRAPTAAESEVLAAGTANEGERIDLVQAPRRVTEIMELVQEGSASAGAFGRACQQAAAAERVEEWVREVYRAVEFECCGPWRNPGGMPTVTRDAGGVVGLHVDNREKRATGLRHRSRRRLCVNLGREDRFFLFINLPLDRVGEEMGLVAEGPCALGDAFLSAYGAYPVAFLRVRPGEAYIAPTENVIHDASSSGIVGPDLTFTAFGYFQPRG